MAMIGVDVGGTFTDLVMHEPETGRIVAGKVPSTTGNLTEGFVQGLDRLPVRLDRVRRLLHGTTVATNAAIERKGARTAGIFTSGFRDVLAIGTGQRFTGGLFNPGFRRATPLIPRSLSFEVRERIDHRGREIAPLNQRDLAEVAARLRDVAVEAVSICFLHAYANEGHERAVETYLKDRVPNLFVCRSGDVLPQIREYERFTATAFNAYLGPVVERYLSALEDRLRGAGYGRDLLLMTSTGGVVSARHASRYPVSTVLSGPAGGVSAGLYLGRALGIENLITYDMGGTSTDVCLIKNLRPAFAAQRIVGGLPLRIPQLDINTIGAGGGSIARIEADGSFRVGPESSGAVPGPACYGRGGEQATVTDANLVLGRLSPANPLGGSLTVRPELARSAVERVAEALGLADVHRAAEGIVRVAVSNMASAIREVSIERGEDPRPFALVAFGGAGPMHGCEVAQSLGLSRVIVPLYPGNFSALGLLVSDLRHEFLRSHLTLVEEADLGTVAGLLRRMGEEGRRLLAEEGAAPSDTDIHYVLELRYRGQAHQLGVEVNPGNLTREALAADFQRLYFDTWSYRPDTTAVQIVNLRVTAVGKAPRVSLAPPTPEASGGEIGEAPKQVRRVYFGGDFHDTPIYERSRLPLQARLLGPAIIDEEGATTVVPPQWRAEVHPSGHLFLHRR
ncbi:MAG: hydantoinase/oxoprolinase family protein [Proteobacteria bacterium]|nr:hydantoinase/oxoprolinase family protein [Pseudomonadota bacterium]